MEKEYPFDYLIDLFVNEIPAERIIDFKSPFHISRRFEFLISKKKENHLSTLEQTELDNHLFIEHLLMRAKAKARKK